MVRINIIKEKRKLFWIRCWLDTEVEVARRVVLSKVANPLLLVKLHPKKTPFPPLATPTPTLLLQTRSLLLKKTPFTNNPSNTIKPKKVNNSTKDKGKKKKELQVGSDELGVEEVEGESGELMPNMERGELSEKDSMMRMRMRLGKLLRIMTRKMIFLWQGGGRGTLKIL